MRGILTGSSDASWRGTKVVLSLGVITADLPHSKA
jgi:hypothetical protein